MMSLEAMLVPTYVQMLGALSAWLGKAAEAKPADEAQSFLTARLAPDMFPLGTQVRFACVQAQEGVFRLRGQALPSSIGILLEEGRNAAANPGSIDDARARIAETIAVVEACTAKPVEVNPATPIAHELPQGMVFDLVAEQYARDWALPQFYFHLVTAYAILRMEGVALGRADYVAHMFAYLRTDTPPSP
jgi:hypothetical protein